MQNMIITGKKRMCLIVVLLGLLLLSLLGACSADTELEVTKTVGTVGEARNAFLASLRQQEPQNAPLKKTYGKKRKKHIQLRKMESRI